MSTAADSKATTVPKLKPVFVKVDQLKPGTNRHTLTVKVVESNPVKPSIRKGSLTQPIRSPRIAECLIGDDTGCILFTARNDQGKDLYTQFQSLLFTIHSTFFLIRVLASFLYSSCINTLFRNVIRTLVSSLDSLF